jgi:hypothetical protein
MIRAALVVIVALLVACSALWLKLSVADRALARVQAELAGEKEAARFRFRLGEAAAGAAALDGELQRGVGANAPLSDYLRAGAGRVWP